MPNEPEMATITAELEGAEYPSKLVVGFPEPYYYVHRINKGNRRQLVHHSNDMKKPPRLVRVATGLRLKKGNKPVIEAVERAYKVVSGNYAPGDQVALFINPPYGKDLDLYLDAAAMLAKNLHNGTCSSDHSRPQSSSETDAPSAQIPIYGVVVCSYRETRGMCKVNDELKSRFPPGIEHIICWTYDDGGSRSCATRFDMTGGIISREIHISGGRNWYSWIHCTKHIIYWAEDSIPKWDEYDPVWAYQLDSSRNGVPDGFSLELIKPVGMYRHELRKYQGVPGMAQDDFMLMWKSYRGVD